MTIDDRWSLNTGQFIIDITITKYDSESLKVSGCLMGVTINTGLIVLNVLNLGLCSAVFYNHPIKSMMGDC